QFNQALSTQPNFTWSIDRGGIGTISSTGVYTAPSSRSGTATIRATSGSISGTATETILLGSVIGDAGFEAPVGGTGSVNDFVYNPTGTPWTFSSTSGVAGNGSGFTSGNPNAPDGSQVAFLEYQGSISQVVNPGSGSYMLSFQAAQRGNFNQGGQSFKVQVDGAVIGIFTPKGATYTSYTTNSFTLTAGPHTITFAGLNPQGYDNTVLLDSTSLNKTEKKGTTAVPPSPSTATVNQAVTLIATVSSLSPGSGNPTSTVTFKDTTNNTVLGTVPVNNGRGMLCGVVFKTTGQ